ncbi:MAG: hypothetical protein V2L15_10430 [Desulfobacteraceae bacterium]|jgi:hypothetical protein|nr:hypothetical protein [Desulfobacteraceae bacterium]
MRLIFKRWAMWIGSLLLAGVALAAEPAPRAVTLETEFEFAPVVEGLPVHHAFVVRNEGDAPLIFGKIQAG